jgi:hypothetical protein
VDEGDIEVKGRVHLILSAKNTRYRRLFVLQKSVGNHVIGPPGPSQFHTFVAIASN